MDFITKDKKEDEAFFGKGWTKLWQNFDKLMDNVGEVAKDAGKHAHNAINNSTVISQSSSSSVVSSNGVVVKTTVKNGKKTVSVRVDGVNYVPEAKK